MEAGPQYFGEYLAALVVDAVRQAASIQSTIEQQQRESYQLYQTAMVSVVVVGGRRRKAAGVVSLGTQWTT